MAARSRGHTSHRRFRFIRMDSSCAYSDSFPKEVMTSLYLKKPPADNTKKIMHGCMKLIYFARIGAEWESKSWSSGSGQRGPRGRPAVRKLCCSADCNRCPSGFSCSGSAALRGKKWFSLEATVREFFWWDRWPASLLRARFSRQGCGRMDQVKMHMDLTHPAPRSPISGGNSWSGFPCLCRPPPRRRAGRRRATSRTQGKPRAWLLPR